MEPTKFGRYEIKGEIGRGGMATVYHAYDPRFEREVAIKVLPREMLHDAQFRTRFEREAKTVAMLEHPAIVPVYDFGEEEGQPYFVMRFMTGGSLSDRMKKGPISIQDTANLIAHLAPALDEAHAKGIIHRDLKPGNILYDQYNEPYVSDFGIAKLSEAQTNVTGSAIVGTPAYMSPEQAQGEGVDGRSDIYGLGVILFEMLTGQQPYHGDTPMSVVVKHITDPVPHILDVKPDLPADIEAVIEKAMAKNRDERFQTVKALAKALTAVARGEKPDLGADATRLASPKTVAGKRGAKTLEETVLSKRGDPTVRAAAAPRKRGGAGVGLGIGVLVLCAAVLAAIFIFKVKIPFLTVPAAATATSTQVASGPSTVQPSGNPTETALASAASPTATGSAPAASPTVTATQPPVASGDTATPSGESPTATLSETPSAPTATGVPIASVAPVGGADQIAVLNDNNVWVSQIDGSQLQQLTNDATGKHDLQWAPDGQSLFYISGKCIHNLTLADKKDTSLTCFTSSDYLDAFEISPDGTQVAISLNHVLYIVPLDLAALSKARTYVQLTEMNGCLTYGNLHNQPIIKYVRWSSDGKTLAADTIAVGPIRIDLIDVLDVSKCDGNNVPLLDNFPGARFTMANYAKNPVIPNFDWDGQSLFLLNSEFAYEFGNLYVYNFDTKKPAINIMPVKSCCYTAATWSPDGSYVFFAYWDSDKRTVQLYYIPYGTVGTGATYDPIALPKTLFQKPNAHIEVALRPVK